MPEIIYVGSVHPLRGGLAAFNERLAQEFQASGYQVKCYNFSLQYPELLFPGKTQYSDDAPPADLHIESVVNSINPFNWLKVGKRIKRERPDMVLMKYWMPFMAPCLGSIARLARSNGHTRVIVIIDNMIPHERTLMDRLFSKWFVKSCDGFIAMSKSVLLDLDLFDREKPRNYCPHPLFDNFGPSLTKEAAKKALDLDPGTDYLLFFGFIRAYKGLDLLIEAFADKRLRQLPLKLIIAGEYYEDQTRYDELIKKHDLSEYIIQSNDFIPNKAVGKYFCAADLVVQPYKTATQSGVTQIAYHFNRPMLVTNVGGLPELIPHGKVGYVVEPAKEPITEAILDYYSNNREAEFTSHVAEEKKQYSWQAMLKKVVDLYGSLK